MYSNFLTTPPDEDPLVRTEDTEGGLISQGALFTFGTEGTSGIAQLQVIHAAANVDVSVVDIYLDGVLVWDDLAYCEATPLLSVDVASKGTGSTATFDVDIAPSTSTSAADAVVSATVDLTESTANIAVAVDSDTDAADLLVADDVRTGGVDPSAVDVVYLNAVSDGGTVDVRFFDGNPQGGGTAILEGVDFGASSDDYSTLDPAMYTVEVLAAGTTDQAFASTVDLTGLEGQPVVVAAVGMINPPAGREASRRRSAPVFDPESDPVIEKAVRFRDTWLFVSFDGFVVPVDVSVSPPRPGERWSLFDAEARTESWRVGGIQQFAVHGANQIRVTVSRGCASRQIVERDRHAATPGRRLRFDRIEEAGAADE